MIIEQTSVQPPMTSANKPARISKELAKRLFPLALGLCFLLSIFIPSLYCFFEYRSIKEEAGTYSKQLADTIKPLVATSPDLWKYQETKYSQIISSFIPHKGISSIAILDERSAPISQYNHTSTTDSIFGVLEIRGNPAPIMFNNRKVGEILISVSAELFLLTGCLVFIACLFTGLPLSVFIYKLPLKIVTKLESQLIDYQQTLEEKAKLEEINRHLQKTESLHRMAGAIAHHFNNQLGVVIGNLEMAIEDMPRFEGPFDNLTEAMQGAVKAAEISGLMLTYLGQTTDKHAILDLSEACRKSLPLLQAAAPKGISFKVDLQSPGPIISANVNQIQQVLTNLINNAWEAEGANQGTIGIVIKTSSPSEISSTHRFPIDWQVQDTPHACMEISDTSCGIAEKDIDKIFDPFFSTKFTGRGLGLPVVLGIVKAHGGGITLESKTGVGSVFRVFFPVSAATVPYPVGSTGQPSIQGVGATVLLVEDEEMVRGMAATMLARLGFNVLSAKDGIEGVQVFQQHQAEIGVVLCDLSMPRMDGWETMSALRRIRPGIPVILASGYDEAQAIADNHPAPPNVFLGKPYQKAALKEALAKAMGQTAGNL